MHRLAAADPQDDADGNGADRLDGGEQPGFINVGHHLGITGFAVEHVEFAAGFVLAGEELDDRDPADRLGKIGVQRREPVADLAVNDRAP